MRRRYLRALLARCVALRSGAHARPAELPGHIHFRSARGTASSPEILAAVRAVVRVSSFGQRPTAESASSGKLDRRQGFEERRDRRRRSSRSCSGRRHCVECRYRALARRHLSARARAWMRIQRSGCAHASASGRWNWSQRRFGRRCECDRRVSVILEHSRISGGRGELAAQ